MPHLITHRGAVYPWQCDHNGHMNVMWYVGKFDEATWCLFADLGITPSYLRDAGRGMVAVEQHLHYKKELFAGDTLEIRSTVVEVSAKSLRFKHTMRKNGEEGLAASATLVGVHIDAASRRACPLPEHLQESIAALLAAHGEPDAQRHSEAS
jgi:acyl-CoA thioester hydrolase